MLKSRRSAVAFAAAFLAAHGAFAFEGRYVAGDKAYRQELEIKKRADGGFDLTAVVGTEGCSGYVDARGAANGDTLRAEALEDKTDFDGVREYYRVIGLSERLETALGAVGPATVRGSGVR